MVLLSRQFFQLIQFCPGRQELASQPLQFGFSRGKLEPQLFSRLLEFECMEHELQLFEFEYVKLELLSFFQFHGFEYVQLESL